MQRGLSPRTCPPRTCLVGTRTHGRGIGRPGPQSRPHFPPALSLSDPWKTLGVGHSASEEEIKRAHRRLVRQHHPDLHAPGDEAVAARFISIQQAYEIVMGRALGRLPESSQHGGWNFHDWFWSFARRRADEGVPKATGPPRREQWEQQLHLLRRKAAIKRGAYAHGAATPQAPSPGRSAHPEHEEAVPGTNRVAPAEQMNRAPGGGAPSAAGDSQPPDADAECAEDTGAGGECLRTPAAAAPGVHSEPPPPPRIPFRSSQDTREGVTIQLAGLRRRAGIKKDLTPAP
uniref:J domain-containing protein n=2 Tax=Auxenochlorella protothecoides TaxID=3075 RepID=A0A1D2A4B3_AUXPR